MHTCVHLYMCMCVSVLLREVDLCWVAGCADSVSGTVHLVMWWKPISMDLAEPLADGVVQDS